MSAVCVLAVPLVALIPLIVLLAGHGIGGIAVTGTLVVVFPTLVTVALGLRALPPHSAELIRACGGGEWTVLRKVGLPAAIPSLLVACRLALPAALVGALLAEWLATGDGLGGRLQRDISMFRAADLSGRGLRS